LLLFVASLARQLWHRFAAQRRSAMAGSVEGWLLLVVVIAIAGRYGLELARVAGCGAMPGIGPSYLMMFGVGCAIYLGAKAVRAGRMRN